MPRGNEAKRLLKKNPAVGPGSQELFAWAGFFLTWIFLTAALIRSALAALIWSAFTALTTAALIWAAWTALTAAAALIRSALAALTAAAALIRSALTALTTLSSASRITLSAALGGAVTLWLTIHKLSFLALSSKSNWRHLLEFRFVAVRKNSFRRRVP